MGIRLGLSGLSFVGVGWASPMKNVLFGTAIGQWSTVVDGMVWESMGAMVAWLAVLTLVTWHRVERMEVP